MSEWIFHANSGETAAWQFASNQRKEGFFFRAAFFLRQQQPATSNMK